MLLERQEIAMAEDKMKEDKYESLLQEVQELPHVEGVIPTNILGLPDSIAFLLRTMMRQGSMTVDELATFLEVSTSQADHLGEQLVARGYLVSETNNSEGGQIYRVFTARMRKRNIPSELF
jgi:predicted transcriptional regulator